MVVKLAKIYAKYQEAVDALRHEQLGRKQSEDILERVCFIELSFLNPFFKLQMLIRFIF